jgi:hypothetical protein
MHSIQRVALPEGALLSVYQRPGCYADCYRTELAGTVTQAQFVSAFYTTPVFRLERWILQWVASRPSEDAEATELAEGRSDRFAAWQVEGRRPEQLLLTDFLGRTRSWLMVVPAADGARTLLYFGSAVVPKSGGGNAPGSLGLGFRALLGFHQLYSRVLLQAAKWRLARRAA